MNILRSSILTLAATVIAGSMVAQTPASGDGFYSDAVNLVRSNATSTTTTESTTGSASLGLSTRNYKGDGARVLTVNTGTYAEAAGLRQGDLIVSINNRSVYDNETLAEALSYYSANDVVTIHYVRNHIDEMVKLKLEAQAPPTVPSMIGPGNGMNTTSPKRTRVKASKNKEILY